MSENILGSYYEQLTGCDDINSVESPVGSSNHSSQRNLVGIGSGELIESDGQCVQGPNLLGSQSKHGRRVDTGGEEDADVNVTHHVGLDAVGQCIVDNPVHPLRYRNLLSQGDCFGE